jgi:hypothetical protein
METRTVTQFHFLTWDELTNPPSVKSILDFRRYVFFMKIIYLKLMRDKKKEEECMITDEYTRD